MTRALMLAALALPALASAFTSQCRPINLDAGIAFPRDATTYHNSICAPADAPSPTPSCAEGFGFARGAQTGEHGWIAYVGMQWAGLFGFLDDTQVLKYYTADLPVPSASSSPSTKSVEPSGPGAMRVAVYRPLSLAELGQANDGSYSLSDYLSGNEHCLPLKSVATDNGVVEMTSTDALVNSCHGFASHMGGANSNHFPPQVQRMYELYHALALTAAGRCAGLRAARDAAAGKHLLAGQLDAYTHACVVEALALQAAAAHFQGDAWSSGHMWERWGSPIIDPDPKARIRASAVGMVSGLIHGWREVARSSVLLQPWQHDQMCMPGTVKDIPADQQERWKGDIVLWTYPDTLDPSFVPSPGAGDQYLLPCEAKNQEPRWALAPEQSALPPTAGLEMPLGYVRPLAPQYRRMMTCVTRGFEEISAAAGEPAVLKVDSAQLDSAIATSGDPLCWEQRVTNNSMKLGAGVADQSFADPGLLAKVTIDGVKTVAAAGGTPSELSVVGSALQTTVGLNNNRLRKQLALMGLLMQREVSRSPTGLSLARLEARPVKSDGDVAPRMLPFFWGARRNSENASLISDGFVPYLERKDMGQWSTLAASDANCRTDVDCAPNQFCDRTALSAAGAVAPRCVAHEAVILRAFRDAETPYFCGAEGRLALDAARGACFASGDQNNPACDACVQLLLPHLRNACSEKAWPAATGGIDATGTDRRSICDLLQTAGLVNGTLPLADSSLYGRYTTGAGARDRARKLCFADALPCGGITSVCAAQPTLIAAGDATTCARTCGGCAQCWGSNANAQLGLDTGGDHLLPEPADWLATAQQIVGGSQFTCARKADGTVWCAGVNNFGQLGDGTTQARSVPVKVAGVAGATRLAAGTYATCAFTSSGVQCWGTRPPIDGSGGTSPSPMAIATQNVTALGVGHFESCAVTADTSVWCWGLDGAGGDALSTSHFDGVTPGGTPLPVTTNNAATPPVVFLGATQVVVTGSGASAACALRNDGTVWCWGDDFYGNLGTGAATQQVATITFQAAGLSGITQLSGNYEHFCALRGSDGTVWCWGQNTEGQLGDGTTTPRRGPVQVVGITSAVEIVAAARHSCARLASGAVWCWGGNASGQLGDGTRSQRLTPVQVLAPCP